MKRIFVALLYILSGICVYLGVSGIAASAEEAADYTALGLQNEAVYTLKSDGSPFYISFGRQEGRSSGEVARVSWVMSEIKTEADGTEKASFGTFCSSKAEIASGWGQDKAAADEEDVAYISVENNFYNLIVYKDGASSAADYIVRSGIYDYDQKSMGNYSDGADSRYGFYFSGVKVEMTFLVTFVFASDFTLYYSEGVTVTECADKMNPPPEVVFENASPVLNASPYELLRHPIYNKKICFIPFMINVSDSETLVYYFDEVTLNGENYDSAVKRDGSAYYLVCALTSEDKLVVSCGSRIISFDEAEIYDLIDVSEKKSITFSELRRDDLVIGNIPNRPNTAFRFKYITPSASSWSGGEINKFGIWTSNDSIWSNFGYIVTFYNNTVRILSGEEVEYASGSNINVKPNNTIETVIGLKKGYDEKGNYIFNRIYVEVNGAEVVHYDDYVRSTLGSAIVGPYLDSAAGKCTIENAYDVYELADASRAEGITAGFARYVKSGGNAVVCFAESEGRRLSFVKLNGEDVTDRLAESGGVKILTIEGISEDCELSYGAEVAFCAVRVEETAGVSPEYPSIVKYKGRAEILFTLKKGLVLSSVTVNGEDFTDGLNVENGVWRLMVPEVKEDMVVAPTTEEKSFSLSVEKADNAAVTLVTENVRAGTDGAFTVSPSEGYKISAVYANGEIMENTDGVYYVEFVYDDVRIKVETIRYEEFVVPGGSVKKGGPGTGLIVGVTAGCIAAAGAVAAVVIVIKKRRN